MLDLLSNPLTRNGLYLLAMAKAFLRYRDRGRREVWRHRVAFYDRAWRDAADQLGAEWTDLGSGITEITLGDFRTRVMDNSSAIDDSVTLALLSDKPLTYSILEAENLPTPRSSVALASSPSPVSACSRNAWERSNGENTPPSTPMLTVSALVTPPARRRPAKLSLAQITVSYMRPSPRRCRQNQPNIRSILAIGTTPPSQR